MLLQSQNGEIHLLPAVPAAWSEGSIHGLRSRGACTVNIDWKGGALTKVSIKSDQGGSYVVRYKEKLKQIRLHAGETIQLDGFLN